MGSTEFTVTLLRTNARGFAAMAVSRTVERAAEDGVLDGGFEAWREHFRILVMELAAAVDDGNQKLFAAKLGWTRDAFLARGLQTEVLRIGLEELGTVLKESLPSEAWSPLPGFFEVAGQELERTAPHDGARGIGDHPLGELAKAYLAIVQEGDGVRAIDLVVAAIREKRLSVSDALGGVLTEALREIGRLWHAGVLNVAEEHFASQTTGRLLEQIVLMAPKPSPYGRTVVLTMVEGDAHDLGLRIVAAFFELDGWRTLCLGANTPAADLSLFAQRFDADLIVIGASLNTQRSAVAHALEVLRGSRPDQKVLVGGPAFSELEGRAQEMGANGCALFPSDAVRLGRELVEA